MYVKIIFTDVCVYIIQVRRKTPVWVRWWCILATSKASGYGDTGPIIQLQRVWQWQV